MAARKKATTSSQPPKPVGQEARQEEAAVRHRPGLDLDDVKRHGAHPELLGSLVLPGGGE